MSAPIWQPDPQRAKDSALGRFQAFVNERYGAQVSDYAGLHRWSVDHLADFWGAVSDFCSMIYHQPAERVLVDADRMPGARWMVGAELNFAENLLRFRDEHPAIIARSESGPRRELSYAELYTAVAQVASKLKALGIKPGDRLVGWTPNIPEHVIMMLGATSLGAVWSSCSPDFGPAVLLDRFGQIEPRLLFSVDSYHYNGKTYSMSERLAEIRSVLPTLEHIVVATNLTDQTPALPAGVETYNDFLDHSATDIEWASLPFAHPLYVLYSSGTTGKPKCIVHSAGGTLLKHLAEHRIQAGVEREDVFFFYTTCGWMMWNWLVSNLAVGCTIVLYDGSPLPPEKPDILLDVAEQESITMFGCSAKYLAALEKGGYCPIDTHDLSAMHTIMSTGSTLLEAQYDYVYTKFKRNVALCSGSGGTDLVGSLVGGNPTCPVYRGEIQAATLGMDIHVYDDDGKDMPRGRGELVCAKPFPSMPLGFWDDPGDERYFNSYYARFENVWVQGDYAEWTDNGGMIVHGRSDTVLNPGGVRIGTAEIYRQVDNIDEINESLVIGQKWDGDTRVVLFVRLQAGQVLNEALINKIKQTLRHKASPRHVPAKIIEVADIPRTLSGKIVELAVRAVVHGEQVKNREALLNPEALDLYKDLPELQT